MNTLELWQKAAENLFDYKFIHPENRISVLPIQISSVQVERWTKDILTLVDLARNISITHNTEYAMLRDDWQNTAQLYLNKPRQPPILRPDCILKDDRLMILELNIDSAIGGLFEMEHIKDLMTTNPLYQDKNFIFPSPKTAVIEYFKSLNIKGNIENIAIVGSQYLESWNIIKVKEFCSWINNDHSGIKAYYMHPDQLKLKAKNIWMEDNERKYQVIYRYRTLLHPKEQVNEFIELLNKAYYSSSAVLSDPVDLFIEHKGIIALLSELAANGDIPPEEKVLINNYIPWTRFLSHSEILFKNKIFDTKIFCLTHKNLLVLKRLFSHHGDFVYIGAETKEIEWNKLITQALKYPNEWIIQKRINSNKEQFGYFNKDSPSNLNTIFKNFVFSPFFFGQYFGGALVRVVQNNDNTVLSLPNLSPMGLAGVLII